MAKLGRSNEATMIAEAVIELAHGLGLKVMAEGAEREDQIEHLRGLGCDQAQGNHFTEPLDTIQIAIYLANQGAVKPQDPVAKTSTLSV